MLKIIGSFDHFKNKFNEKVISSLTNQSANFPSGSNGNHSLAMEPIYSYAQSPTEKPPTKERNCSHCILMKKKTHISQFSNYSFGIVLSLTNKEDKQWTLFIIPWTNVLLVHDNTKQPYSRSKLKKILFFFQFSVSVCLL